MKKLCLTLSLALILAGCASKEVLVSRSSVAPAGVDLTGQWRIRTDSADTNQRLVDAQVAAAGGRDRILDLPRAGKSDRKRGSLVHVFLETGSALKITQVDAGLFISFDRSIVEEYGFGEYTRISVGPVTADRSSGWEGDAYVIETLDDNGDKLYELYQLQEGGALLIRQISIWSKGVLDMSLVQKFERMKQ